MKIAKAAMAAAAAVLVMGGSVAAYAGGGHHRYHGGVRFGVFVGAPAYWYYPRPYYYYPPYPYYYPSAAVAPAEPPVYIERNDSRAAPATPQDYWYYCPESNAYYPYVKQCAQGWQRVAPQPQG